MEIFLSYHHYHVAYIFVCSGHVQKVQSSPLCKSEVWGSKDSKLLKGSIIKSFFDEFKIYLYSFPSLSKNLE